MKRTCSAILLAAALPFSASAQVYFPEIITVSVNAVSSNSFEVLEKPLVGPAQVWCAAGIYAKRKLGHSRGDVAIVEAYGPAQTAQGARGVTFTTQDVPGAFKDISATYRNVGKTMSVGLATSLCETNPEIRIRIRTDGGIYRN